MPEEKGWLIREWITRPHVLERDAHQKLVNSYENSNV